MGLFAALFLPRISPLPGTMGERVEQGPWRLHGPAAVVAEVLGRQDCWADKNAASARGWGAGSYRNRSELAERLPRGR